MKRRVFPSIGKSRTTFSKPWNKAVQVFQGGGRKDQVHHFGGRVGGWTWGVMLRVWVVYRGEAGVLAAPPAGGAARG
ncbi:MAG: hypothetical protein NTY53_07985, partial [Kiritimatiellaeota bacterium]|nr:hypothetical protein [Kiritimatiellota bacterium]